MNNPHPEVEVLFIACNQADAESCYNHLKTSGHYEVCFKIIPKYYISGKAEPKLDARENMIVVFHADKKEDFDKIKDDITHFHNCKYRCLFSNKDEANSWMEEFHDHGIKILIGMNDDSLHNFKDLVIFFLKSHGGWKEGHIPEHKEHKEHKHSHHKDIKSHHKKDANIEESSNIKQEEKTNPIESHSTEPKKESQGGI